MNTMTATAAALPTVLDRPSSNHYDRRERIGDFRLDAAEVDRFNRLLTRLGRTGAPLGRDQLATAARELRGPEAAAPPPCITQRMRRVAALRWMVADGAWTPTTDAVALTMVVIGYVSGHDDLIPDQLHGCGRLDDAIVVETAWSRLAPELESYLDFRRLHLLEASLRGCPDMDFEFTRTDWQQARAAEAAIASHRRSVRERSYLPQLAPVFRVH